LVAPPLSVVVVVVELVPPPEPPDAGAPEVEPLPEVGALYSESPSGLLQPGSDRSTRPSPSSSERFEHCGRTVPPPPLVVVALVVVVLVVVVLGTWTCAFSGAIAEAALPAAIIARAPPRAMVTRSFFVIGLADVARGHLGWRFQPPCTRRHIGRY
jgi:hypothetical protein